MSISTGASLPAHSAVDLLYCDPGINGASNGCHVLRGTGGGTFTKGDDFICGADGVYTGVCTAAFLNPFENKYYAVTLSNRQTQPSALDVTLQGGPTVGYLGIGFTISGTKAALPGPIQSFPYDTSAAPRNATNFGILIEEMGNGYLYLMHDVGQIATSLLLADGTGPFIVGDFNSDGNNDVLILGTTNNVVTFYPGKGDGTFAASQRYVLSGGIYSILAQDIDGDGIADLVVEGANGALSYFPGTSTGFSSTAVPLPGAQDGTTGNGGHLVAIADLNGDHIPDIITSTPAGISVLLGQPPLTSHTPYSPSYTLLGIYNAGPGRSSYALADFNGDGHLDLAVDSPEGIAVLFGNADGSFQTSHSYAAGQPAYSVALGQFTGSGNVDALVATGIPQIQLLNGDGQGGFAVTTPPSPSTVSETNPARALWSSAVAGDFDGDGSLDVAITQASASNVSGEAFILQFGSNTGTFGSFVAENQAGHPHYGVSVVGDFNGDGKSDIATFTPEGCVMYAGGIGARPGNMPPTVLDNNLSAAAYNLVATGFLTSGHTNKQDIVCQDNGTLLVYRNKGNGTFTQTATITPPSGYATAGSSGVFPASGLFPSALLLADLDGDGFGDIIVVYNNLAADPAHPNVATSNQIYTYWGNGDGTFSAPTILTGSRNYYQAAVADVNGDGKPDLILSDGYLISVSPDPGRGVSTEQHYLAGMGINGIATTTINGMTALVLANGGAVLANPSVNRGTLASNAEVDTGGVTVLYASPKPALETVTGTLTASPEPSQYNQDFTLTATVVPPGTGVPATGTVTFSINGTVVGTSSVTGGTATFAVVAPTYPPGTYALTAAYSGDINYAAAALTGSHVVALQPSTTYLTGLATPISFGQVIGDIAVANADPLKQADFTGSTAGGTIVVFIDGVNTGCVLVVGNMGRCPNSVGAGYSVGSHTIYLVYSGNQFFAGSTSITYSVTILADATTGTLTSSLNPATFGTSVKFTAVFSAPFATPTGTVTFLDGATVIGTGTLDATGTATLTTSTLALGTHPITASYAGTTNFNGSTTAILQQMIVPPAIETVTLLGSSVNPSTLGQNVTFTASLAITSMQTGTLGGTMTFTIDGSTAATVAVSMQGSASFSISTLALGSHNVVASYSGVPGVYNPSTSGTLVQVVNPMPTAPSFTVTVNPAAISVPIGNSVSVLVTVTALNGFSQPVTLTCSGLVREGTCAFDATTMPSGGGTTHLTVTASAPHNCDNNTPYFITPSGSTTLLGLLGTCGLIGLVRRRRGVLKGIALSLALCILPALAGCGHCTDLGVPPGNYTFTVTGTSTGSPSTAVSQTVKMVAHL